MTDSDDKLDNSSVHAHVTVAVRIKPLGNLRPGIKDELCVYPNSIAEEQSLVVKGVSKPSIGPPSTARRRNSLTDQTFTFDHVHWSAGDSIK